MELAKDKAKFFYDQFEDSYAVTNNKIIKLSSKKFEKWLSYVFYQEENAGISSEAINSAANTLAAYARYEKTKKKLNVRVGWKDGVLWYDLANEEGEAAKITKEGWKVTEPPIMFKRFEHMRPQVKPNGKDGTDSIDSILVLCNPTLQNNERMKLLFKVQLVANFIPDFPHAINCPYGPQGSAKSFLHTVMREIIDPSELETLQYTTNIKELTQKVSHHWFPPFDNITELPQKVSDFFCRAVTGQGFSKRQLYTDDSDFIYKFKRPIGLNGINTVPQKPDLLDRTILYELERIPKEKRKTEEELKEELEEIKPGVLASIFDIISEAMKIKRNMELEWKPRMADFAEWGEAIARAMGEPKGKFLRAYQKNINSANAEALEAHIIGEPIRKLVKEERHLEKSPNELLDLLNEKAEELNIETSKKKWPGAPNWVWRRINEIKPNLQEIGIKAYRTKGKDRKIILKKIDTPSSKGNTSGVDAADGVEGGSSKDSANAIDGNQNNLSEGRHRNSERKEVIGLTKKYSDESEEGLAYINSVTENFSCGEEKAREIVGRLKSKGKLNEPKKGRLEVV